MTKIGVKAFAALLGLSMLATSLPVSATELDEPEDNSMNEESGIVDTTPPKITSLKFVENEQGYMEFIATGTDDLSGLCSVSFGLTKDMLSNEYCNTVCSTKSVTNKDGVTTICGTISFTSNTVSDLPATFYISGLSAMDYAGNSASYTQDSIPEGVEKTVTFSKYDETDNYGGGNTEVDASEYIKSMTFDKTEVCAGDTISIKVVVGEKMENRPTELTLQFDYVWNSYLSPMVTVLKDEDGNGEYIGELVVPEHQPGREYRAWILSANYTTSLWFRKVNSFPTFTVTNSVVDTKAPEIKSIKIKNSIVSVPGSIEVIADLADDYSGILSASMNVTLPSGKTRNIGIYERHIDGKNGYANSKYEDGLWHGYIDIDQYCETGVGTIDSIYLRDVAGNSTTYPLDEKITFQVVNDSDDTDKMTSTTLTSLIDDIKNSADDATISVDITGGKELPKEALSEIKGTNKKLLLNYTWLQWVINGKDVTDSIEDIDFNGEYLYYDDPRSSGLFSKIKDIIQDDSVPFFGVKLLHNGDLPCKAMVRVIPNNTYYMSWFPKTGIYIYSVETDSQSVQLVKENASMINGTNLEFEISKGGVYIFTPEKLDTTSKNDTPDEPNTPNKPSSPSTPDTPSKPTTPTTPDAPDKTQNPDEEIPTGPSTWESKEGTEGFVYRLYNVALTRDAEQAGLNDWNNKLQSKTQTAAEVAQGIFFSPEFQNKEYSDVQYVKLLYRTMFGREADENGLKGWLDKLNSGMSREYVFRGFAESQEFENLCNSYNINRGTVTLGQYRDKNEGATGYVARLYTKMLGRKFEENGIEYWCKEYLTGKVTIENIATNGFLHSQEFTNLNLSDEEFVTRMYQTFLNREPDEAGYKDWVGKLKSGQKTRDDLVYGFSLSQEFSNLKKSYGL